MTCGRACFLCCKFLLRIAVTVLSTGTVIAAAGESKEYRRSSTVSRGANVNSAPVRWWPCANAACALDSLCFNSVDHPRGYICQCAKCQTGENCSDTVHACLFENDFLEVLEKHKYLTRSTKLLEYGGLSLFAVIGFVFLATLIGSVCMICETWRISVNKAVNRVHPKTPSSIGTHLTWSSSRGSADNSLGRRDSICTPSKAVEPTTDQQSYEYVSPAISLSPLNVRPTSQLEQSQLQIKTNKSKTNESSTAQKLKKKNSEEKIVSRCQSKTCASVETCPGCEKIDAKTGHVGHMPWDELEMLRHKRITRDGVHLGTFEVQTVDSHTGSDIILRIDESKESARSKSDSGKDSDNSQA